MSWKQEHLKLVWLGAMQSRDMTSIMVMAKYLILKRCTKEDMMIRYSGKEFSHTSIL